MNNFKKRAIQVALYALVSIWLFLNFELGRQASDISVMATGNIGIMPVIYMANFIASLLIGYKLLNEIGEKWGN